MMKFEEQWQDFATARLAGLGPRELAAAKSVFYAGGSAAFYNLTCVVSELPAAEMEPAVDALHAEFAAELQPRESEN